MGGQSGVRYHIDPAIPEPIKATDDPDFALLNRSAENGRGGREIGDGIDHILLDRLESVSPPCCDTALTAGAMPATKTACALAMSCYRREI